MVEPTKTLQWLCNKNQKLSTLSLNDFDCDELMSFIKEQVKAGEVNKATCEHWGEMILYAWKMAPDVEDEGVITKAKLEADVIQDLFYFSVIYPKRYAQRFSWVVDGFVPKLTKKRFNFMFFRCLLPILWRNLESVNEDVRLSASRLLLKFYPLRSEDDVINEEYLQKQTVAMGEMLTDDCLPIRVEAVKKVLLHLRLHWSLFPRYMIKIYLGKIVDELSLDKVDEVRVAVYEGMTHLIYCPQAKVAVQHALRILGRRGINDRTAIVRQVAFKLLNALINHRHFNCFELVNMSDILHRLNFEHSEGVQRQIVRLIFKSFCPTNASNMDRFSRVLKMCKISRNASLNFHRHIYSLKLIDCELARTHIFGLVYCIKKRLLENERRVSETVSDAENSLMNQTGNLAIDFTFNTMNDTAVDGRGKKHEETKDVLDSAIVLWTTMRCDLHQKFPDENEYFQKIMENILEKLKDFLDTPFVDSAMVIASNLPSRRISKSLQDKIIDTVSRGNVDEIYLASYIEALSSWDADQLAQLIISGLNSLYKTLACDANGVPIRLNAPRPALARLDNNMSDGGDPMPTISGSDNDSPPMKRVRKNQQPKGQSRTKRNATAADGGDQTPVDYSLRMVSLALASPVALANLRGRDDFHIAQFAKILRDIRTAFAIRLLRNDLTNRTDLSLMVNCFETLTLLSIILKPSEDDMSSDESSDDEVTEQESTLIANSMDRTANDAETTESTLCLSSAADKQQQLVDRRVSLELKWLRKLMLEVQLPGEVIKMFLRCINLYFDCYRVSLRVLRQSTDLIVQIFQTYDMELIGDEMRDCAKHLSDALQYCEDNDNLMIKGLLDRLRGLANYAPDGEEEVIDDNETYSPSANVNSRVCVLDK